MDVYLIRHSPVAIEKGICYGQTDVPLAADYPELFQQLKKSMEKVAPDIVFSSPASRCLQMAQLLSSKVIKDERLWELHFGEWEQKKWDELPETPFKAWTENYVEQTPPGGESYRELFQRTKYFWQEEILTRKEQTVFIITHGGPIRSILAMLLEIPLTKSFSLQIDLSSISKVKLHDGFNTVEFINRSLLSF